MNALPPAIASLFAREPALCGFSVRGGGGEQLLVGDLGVSPLFTPEQYEEIFREVIAALKELLSEEPGAAELLLRGRTFARVLH